MLYLPTKTRKMSIDDIVKEELFNSSKDELIRAKDLIEDYLVYLEKPINDDYSLKYEEELKEEEYEEEEE